MRINKGEAVLNSDGEVKSFTLIVGGNDFFCSCGCNCFHKPDKTDLTVYACNGCGKKYKNASKR